MKLTAVKKALILLPVLLIVLALPAVAGYKDTNGHWGEAAVNEWSDYGIVQGADGFFRPNDDIRRAEMAAIISRLLKLYDKAPNTFTDLPAGEWYEADMLRCVEAGIMQGDGGGIIRPLDPISRQEAVVMLGRAWKIAEVKSGSMTIHTFTDSGDIASWALGYMQAFYNKGFINGMGDGTVAPRGNINRASVVTILSNAISFYVNSDGQTVNVPNGAKGMVLIAAKDAIINGNVGDAVLAAAGASNGRLFLSGAYSSVIIDGKNVQIEMDNGTISFFDVNGTGVKIILGEKGVVTAYDGTFVTENKKPVTPGTNPDQGGTTNPDQGGTTNPDQGGTTNPDQGGTTNPDQGGTTNPDQGGTTPEVPVQPSNPGSGGLIQDSDGSMNTPIF